MHIETFKLGELQENGYLVCGDAADGEGAEPMPCVAIDPGDCPKTIIARLDVVGAKPLAILLTHGHWDHVGGVRGLKGAFDAPVYLHEADAALYGCVAEQAAMFGFHADAQPPLDKTVAEGDELEFGPLRFRVLHTPGHTPGGVCYRIEDTVFVGDTIFAGGIGRFDLPGGSGRQLLESIQQKLFTLDDALTLYPGHGPPTTVGTERATNPFVR